MENREELKRFLADIQADRELYRKVEEIGRRMVEAGSKKSGNELMAKAAAELGYSITAAELERAEAAAEEVDDNQLEGVCGGANNDSGSGCLTDCTVNFACTTTINKPNSAGYYEQCRRYPYDDSGHSYFDHDPN